MQTLLARFKLAHKLLIASLGFAVPLVLLLYYLVASYGAGIRAAEGELGGTRTLIELERLAELLAPGRSRLTAGIDVQPAGLPPDLSARLRDAVRGRDAGVARGLILEAIHQLGDSSGLLLDPALDAYYLMDAAVLTLPKVQADLGEALETLARTGKAPGLDWTASSRIGGKLGTALRENSRGPGTSASMQARLPGLVKNYETARAAFLGSLGGGAPAGELLTRGQAFSESGFALWRGAAEELQTLLKHRVKTEKRQRFYSLCLGLLSIAFATALMGTVARNVVRPLERVAEIAGEIAAGRLERAEECLAKAEVRRLLGVDEIPAGARDETWRMFEAFRAMTHRLASLLFEVRNSGLQVSGSANQTAAAVRELEATVAEQASSTSSVAATSNEIFATVKDLAKTMSTVTEMAAEAAELANSGVDNLGGINAAVEQLLASASHVSQTLRTIREQSARITGVIGAITKIANRTNLLSLNAAIQAEKAGERAAGFSVVAVEIRRLADQTAVAALDIEESIHEMQGAVEAGVEGVERYSGQARASSETVARLTADLGRLLEYTQKLGPYFGEVNTGMQVQAEGAGHITAAMQELDEAARQTRDSLAGFRQVTESMREAVVNLDREVARFSSKG